MKNLFLLFLVISSLSFNACTKLKKVEGNGNVIVKEFEVNDFDRSSFDGGFDVVLHESTENRVTVTTDSNIMEHVEVFVSNTEVKVEMSNDHFRYDPTELTVHIYAPVLRYAGINGSGTLICADTLNSNQFEMKINGSGNAKVKYDGPKLILSINGSGNIDAVGATTNGAYYINGSGSIEANDVEANIVHADINGSGNIHAHVVQQLFADIDGSGSIYYSGNPEVNTTISGSGKVVHN